MFSCSSKWQHSKNRLGVEKIAAVLQKTAHGTSFIKLSVDFILKVNVGTKARFCLRTSFRIYKYAGTCAKNCFIDPSQGKIMHACISSEITICVRDSTRSQSPATYIHPITCSLQSALRHIHTSLRCSTSGLPFSYLN